MTNIKLVPQKRIFESSGLTMNLCRSTFKVICSCTFPYPSRAMASTALQEVSDLTVLLIFAKGCILQVAQLEDKTKFLISLPFFVPSLCKSLIARAL